MTERLLARQVASRRGLSVSAYIREAVLFHDAVDGEVSEDPAGADCWVLRP